MTATAYTVLAVYTLALFYITVYCLMQFTLLYHYWRAGKNRSGRPRRQATPQFKASAYAMSGSGPTGSAPDEEEPAEVYPFVTIQLPIYNEKYVVERLIDNIVQFDYPRDRFEVQVLDDSTDETAGLTRRTVARYRAQGVQIEQVRRSQRQGFKAGALRDAMPLARGEFIAIFDADFLPHAGFLKQTLPHFEDPGVGVVQTRWGHLNEEYSLLTRLQALQLNVHFTVEQKGRMAGGYLLQFNGTAGIWRRAAIEEAGGWEADTLTEDLDLSIRAQLRGWKICYLEDVVSPAELPVEMNSLKSQQFRWMKGGAETARKMLPTVWRSGLSVWQKVQSTFHLLASTVFVFVLLTGLSSVPLLFFLDELMALGLDRDVFVFFLAGLLSIIAVYYTANVAAPIHDESRARLLGRFVVRFPLFLAMSMGLSLHNAGAVLQGWFGRPSEFVRTPKFNIKDMGDKLMANQYLSRRLSWTTVGEGLLALYFLGAVAAAWYLANYMFVLFHALLAFGFGAVFYYSLRHLYLK